MVSTEEPIQDSSLLRCTLKKSWQVLKKSVVYVSYAIAAVLVAVLVYFGALAIYEKGLPYIIGIWQFLVGVPWYIYMGIIGFAAIPVYSFLWCVARDLTEEDWKSETANNFALAFALAPALALAVAAVDPVDHITIWYYIFRFPGATWHHYRKKKTSGDVK